MIYRFDVFGRIVDVEREGGGWQASIVGADGKRRAADFLIPEFIADHELAQFLDDLFHESATPANAAVRRIR